MTTWMKWVQRIARIGLLLLLVAVVGFLVWAVNPVAPTDRALTAVETAREVDGAWVFGAESETGLILYPGGRVDARAYAAVAEAIAAEGYLVIVPEVLLNLAVFDANRADEIIAAYPAVEAWAIGGHSLGGAMAAAYTNDHLGIIDGLVLWAAYPAGSDDLSTADLPVVSIYGTLDGLATIDKIDASRPLLPADTQFVPIMGGNHAQFGDYGEQGGDNAAAITTEAQQAQMTAATLALLAQIDGSGR